MTKFFRVYIKKLILSNGEPLKIWLLYYHKVLWIRNKSDLYL